MTARSEQRRTGRIVVGVDGSAGAKEALRWAARQAEITSARLQVVMTWEVPAAAYGFAMPVLVGGYDLGPPAEMALNQMVEEIRGDFPGIEVSGLVVEGHAGPALLAAAAGSELLVVGSRGHGEFVGMLLGSVSEYCVTHAPCPVVVVRHGKGAVTPDTDVPAP